MRKKRTKATQIKTATAEKVIRRDQCTCIFCYENYHMGNSDTDRIGMSIHDIMHFIPRSQGGRGIEQNLAVGCRYHHQMLDNGKDGNREEMLGIFEKHLRIWYKDWNREDLIYRKGEL